MEIVALESSLIKGMVEVLPAPGTAMTVARRSEWLDMMGRSLGLVYPEAAPLVVAPHAIEQRHHEAEGAIALLEARPRVPKVETAFSERLQERKAVAAPRAKKEEPDRPRAGLALGRKPGVLVGVIKAALAAHGAPMSVKALRAWAMKHRAGDVAKYVNLNGNLYQACVAMVNRGELEDGAENGVTVYMLKG